MQIHSNFGDSLATRGDRLLLHLRQGGESTPPPFRIRSMGWWRTRRLSPRRQPTKAEESKSLGEMLDHDIQLLKDRADRSPVEVFFQLRHERWRIWVFFLNDAEFRPTKQTPRLQAQLLDRGTISLSEGTHGCVLLEGHGHLHRAAGPTGLRAHRRTGRVRRV